jgi:hypothetical protein
MENSTNIKKKSIFSKWWFWLITIPVFLIIFLILFAALLRVLAPETVEKIEKERIEAEKRVKDSLEAIEKKREFQKEQQRLAIKEIEDIQNYLKSNLKIKNFSWQVGGFGNVGIVNVTLLNSSDTIIYKDITLKATFKGESDLVLSSDVRLLPIKVFPKSTRTIKDINFGLINSQSAKASLSIEGFNIEVKSKK